MALASVSDALSTGSLSAILSDTSSGAGYASLLTTSMPLTTIFTPPASCADRPFTYWTDDGDTSTFWRDLYLGDSQCYPYSYAYQHEPTVSAVYSPGVCPGAYYAAQYTANGATGAQTSWCCPIGMTYGNYACQSLVTGNTIAVYDESTNVSMTKPFIAADWYIQVAWAATNLDVFKPASAPVLTTTSDSASSITSVPTRVALGTSGPTKAVSGPANTDTPPSLSTGAKAGIGVGAAIGCVAVIGAVAFFVFRRKRQQKWNAVGSAAPEGDGGGPQNVKYGFLHPRPVEVHEADGTSKPTEMQGSEYRAELSGGWEGSEMRQSEMRGK